MVAGLTAELTSLRNQRNDSEQLRQRLAFSEGALQALQADHKAAEQELRELRILPNQLERVMADCTDLTATNGRLAATEEGLRMEVARLTEKIRITTEEAWSSARNRVNETESELSRVQVEKDLAQRLADAEAKNAKLRAENDRLKARQQDRGLRPLKKKKGTGKKK